MTEYFTVPLSFAWTTLVIHSRTVCVLICRQIDRDATMCQPCSCVDCVDRGNVHVGVQTEQGASKLQHTLMAISVPSESGEIAGKDVFALAFKI